MKRWTLLLAAAVLTAALAGCAGSPSDGSSPSDGQSSQLSSSQSSSPQSAGSSSAVQPSGPQDEASGQPDSSVPSGESGPQGGGDPSRAPVQSADESASSGAPSSSTSEEEPEPKQDSSDEQSAEEPKAVTLKFEITGDEFDGYLEQEIFELVNDEREAEGLNALVWNDTLAKAARYRSAELFSIKSLEHERPNGDSCFTVLKQEFPVNYRKAGENLARMSTSNYSDFHVEDWIRMWMESTGHRENILKEVYSETGIGVYSTYEDGKYYAYCTQLFIAR